MKHIVYTDGSYAIFGERIRLLECYPSINGRALRPVRVEASEEEILYVLPGGSLTLRFRENGERFVIDCAASGLPGIHDVSPLDSALVEGAASVFVQGFGMEGPSGCFPLTVDAPASHGLTALYAGSDTLLAYAEEHQRYSLSFRVKNSGGQFADQAVFGGTFNLEGTSGGAVSLPSLFLEDARGLAEGLRRCASRIAKAMNARRAMPPAFFWSSWYYAYETMDQSLLEQTLSELRTAAVPFRYIELDAGYTPHLGDWLTPNHRWPGGLKKAAETILEAGFRPGIWLGPFIVGDGSALYREHPDWILRDLEGKSVVQLRSYTEPKIWGNPDCDYYVLDASHPGALAYLKSVFETLRGWGFSFTPSWVPRCSATWPDSAPGSSWPRPSRATGPAPRLWSIEPPAAGIGFSTVPAKLYGTPKING